MMRILLVEDKAADADLIAELLAEGFPQGCQLSHVMRLADALTQIADRSVAPWDVVLLDLTLPDSHGLETVMQIRHHGPELPVVVLSALDNQDVAYEAVRQGAQDYLVKGHFEGELLQRAIRYAIERQHHQRQLHRKTQQELLMGRILESLRLSLDLSRILEITLTELVPLLGATQVGVLRCCDGVWELVASLGCTSSTAIIDSLNQGDGLHWPWLLIEAEPSALAWAIWEFEAPPPEEGIELVGTWCDGELMFPSSPGRLMPDRLWGALMVVCDRPLEDWEEDFLQRLADHLAVAIHQSALYQKLAIANQKLRQLACSDGLTGIANRRLFDRTLALECQRAQREHQPLSLILGDIDFFKAYNDTLGHPAGDECLQQVAQAMVQVVRRSTDLVARYGGEEFAVILPHTAALGSVAIAEAIQRHLAQRALPHPASTVADHITLSLGIACWDGDAIPDCPSQLIAMADQALYQAKQGGRNGWRIVGPTCPLTMPAGDRPQDGEKEISQVSP